MTTLCYTIKNQTGRHAAIEKRLDKPNQKLPNVVRAKRARVLDVAVNHHTRRLRQAFNNVQRTVSRPGRPLPAEKDTVMSPGARGSNGEPAQAEHQT